MNVLMVSTSYPENPQDWRGRFIADMVTAVAVDSSVKLALWAPPGEIPQNVVHAYGSGDSEWLRGLLLRGGIAHLLRQGGAAGIAAAAGLLRRLWRLYHRGEIDVAHINWLQNALPLGGSRVPAVITVLGTDFKLLKLPWMTSMLRYVLRRRRAILAPNAGWMVPALRERFGDVAEIVAVPFGVEASWFAVRRHAYSEGAQHWLVVTRLTRNKLGHLFEWGEGLFGPHRVLHLFGPMQEEIQIPDWVTYHGPAQPADIKSTWFPKVAGLITLSCHDEGRPQVMLEAMAAGLPVIASDLPAHRDFIVHKQTGWLARLPEEYAEGLNWLEQPQHNQSIGAQGRKWVEENIGTWDDCAARYVALYERLLEGMA